MPFDRTSAWTEPIANAFPCHRERKATREEAYLLRAEGEGLFRRSVSLHRTARAIMPNGWLGERSRCAQNASGESQPMRHLNRQWPRRSINAAATKLRRARRFAPIQRRRQAPPPSKIHDCGSGTAEISKLPPGRPVKPASVEVGNVKTSRAVNESKFIIRNPWSSAAGSPIDRLQILASRPRIKHPRHSCFRQAKRAASTVGPHEKHRCYQAVRASPPAPSQMRAGCRLNPKVQPHEIQPDRCRSHHKPSIQSPKPRPPRRHRKNSRACCCPRFRSRPGPGNVSAGNSCPRALVKKRQMANNETAKQARRRSETPNSCLHEADSLNSSLSCQS